MTDSFNPTASNSAFFQTIASLPFSRPHDQDERRASMTESTQDHPKREYGAVPSPTRHVVGGGQPIPDATRRPIEEKLGADFSAVRLHHDHRANFVANKLGARAFTVGADVFFSDSEFAPTSQRGRKLLTHELAHTIQQQQTGMKVQRSIIVGTEPWFDLNKIRGRFGQLGVETYFKMQEDVTPHLFPTEDRLFEQLELMMTATKLMSQHAATGSALSTSVYDDSCCRYPGAGGRDEYYLNDKYWKRVSTAPAFEMLPNTLPSEAVRAIFEPGAGSVMECHTTMVAVRYLTELKRLGDDKFNYHFSGYNAPLISPYFSSRQTWAADTEHPLYANGYVNQELVTYDPQDPTKHLLPGDHVYFRNDKSCRDPLWVGEHAMYIGNGLFVGFGARNVMDSQEITESRGGQEQTRTVETVQYALTHDEMILELQSVLPDPSTPIPGLEDPLNPGRMRVRRPTSPPLSNPGE